LEGCYGLKAKGFTLIELVIVLVLMSLSIALVTPSLSRISGTLELKAAAKKIAAVLRYCRSEAVQKGKVQQVFFDNDRREIRIEGAESPEGKKEEPKRSAPPRAFPIPGGIRIKEVKTGSAQTPGEIPVVEFYPNGGSNGASIVLERENQKGLRITVHFLTGVVEVEGA
jgi:general secretion pathway protein H